MGGKAFVGEVKFETRNSNTRSVWSAPYSGAFWRQSITGEYARIIRLPLQHTAPEYGALHTLREVHTLLLL